MADFQTCLESFVEFMSELEEDVKKLLDKDGDPSLVSRRKRLKYLWNERIMKDHLQETQCQASALHLLLDATLL